MIIKVKIILKNHNNNNDNKKNNYSLNGFYFY